MPDAPANRPVVAQATPVAREAPRSAAAQLPLTVRYFRRMRPHRVYQVVVTCDGKGRVRQAEPVVLRLIMAGAQVVPSEHTLDPSQPKARVTFYVTPLARGWLKAERLEVVQQGKKVQEVKLPVKVTTQRMTWLLLALTFLVPMYIVPYFTTSPLTTHDDSQPSGQTAEPDPDAKGGKPPKKGKIPPKAGKDATADGAKKDLKPELRAGRALEKMLERNAPHVPTWIDGHWNKDDEWVDGVWPAGGDALRSVRDHIGAAYDYLYFTIDNNKIPLGYFTVCIFLVLTVLSWFMHLERPGRRVIRAS